jgi:hypothetical protein
MSLACLVLFFVTLYALRYRDFSFVNEKILRFYCVSFVISSLFSNVRWLGKVYGS